MESAFRNTSGPITAEPKLRNAPPSSCEMALHIVWKSRPEATPIAPKSTIGCWWMISVPSAMW